MTDMTVLRGERGPAAGTRHRSPAFNDLVGPRAEQERVGRGSDFFDAGRDRKRAQQRLTAQHAVAGVLAESVNLNEAAPGILQSVCESLGWELGALWKADAAAGQLRCVAVWHQPARPVPQFCAATREAIFACGAGFPGRIWADAKPVWVENVAEDARCPRASIAAKEGLHAAFGFPITIQHEVVGVIEFFSHEIQPPDEDLLRMMATIGSQLGQFIVRKQMEESLAEERNLLRTLIDTLPDAIYVKDAESRFVLANVGVAQLMGAARPEDLYGKKDSDFYPPNLARQYFADEQAMVESGQPLINHEEPVIDPRGEQRWLLTTKAPLRDSRGRITGLVGIGRDITERKRVEEQRDLSQARLQAILDNTTAVIYLKDRQGRYLLINSQYESLFHISREWIVGKSDYDLFSKEMADAFRANDLKVLTAAAPIQIEEVVPHDDGLHFYISLKFPLHGSTGFPYAICGISTDITERKRAEVELKNACTGLARSEEALRTALAELKTSHEELKATQSQLIQAEKLESIGTLAAGVAHEVRNPLQTILAGVDFLCLHAARRRETVPMVLTEMRDAIRRADSIVRELLEFSATNHPDVRDEDLNAIARHSLNLMQYELKKHHITLAQELATDLPMLQLERNKIQQVFINLFLNAVEAMPDGGTLAVRTYARPLAGEQLTALSGASSRSGPGETLVIAEIEDTGAGIPPDQITKIFDPFFTTKPTGTGLGLPVSKKIIELHGGAIHIANREQGGVRVAVVFKTSGGKNYEKETNPDH